MTPKRSFFLLLGLCCYVFPPQAASQPECPTIKYVEDLNNGAVKRIAHIKSKNAIVFIALDPIWSAAEFQHGGYIDRGAIISDATRESLVNAGIDEIVIWKLTRTHGLAAAVPFKDGCVVKGYGEPDLREKLINMHKAFLLISKHGVEDSSVRDGIKKILMSSRYAGDFYAKGSFKDGMIDVMIDNLPPLMTKDKPS
jgi:hypothetical protein